MIIMKVLRLAIGAWFVILDVYTKINVQYYYNILNSGITVALQLTSYTTAETDGPLSICVQMFTGNLERDVSLSASTADGTAIGTLHFINTHKFNTILILTKMHEKILIISFDLTKFYQLGQQ